MRPGAEVPWESLPKEVQRELGVSKKKTPQRMTAWKDIPSSDGWKICKPHGLAWRGEWPCCYCEGEGNSDVRPT